jgi:hypothetical protein
MKRLKKILGSKHAKQPTTSVMPPSITSRRSESEPDVVQTSISSPVVSKSSFFRCRCRCRHITDSHLKPPETSASTPSSVSGGDHQDAVKIPTVESIAAAPTVGMPLPPEHPEIVMTVPKIADIRHVSAEGEVHASNTATQSVLQGAHNVNLADATLNIVGGDQINHACHSIQPFSFHF